MDIPADIAAQAFLTRQAVALSVIKQAADTDKKLAGILEQAADNLATSGRGQRVNIRA